MPPNTGKPSPGVTPPVLHAIRRDPVRAAALADLRANPVGTLQWWGDRWGMKKDAVHRFLHALLRAGLIMFATSPYGTSVTFLDVDADSTPARADRDLNAPGTRDASAIQPRRIREATAKPLARLVTGSTWPSEKFSTASVDVIAYGGETGSYVEKLIRAMNRACTETFGESHRPVNLDNKGSKRGGDTLGAEGVPIEFAIEQLVLAVRRFNPLKHGKGSLPRTVAYFQPGISHKWRQPELALLSLESGSDKPDPADEIKPEEISAAIGDLKQRLARS